MPARVFAAGDVLAAVELAAETGPFSLARAATLLGTQDRDVIRRRLPALLDRLSPAARAAVDDWAARFAGRGGARRCLNCDLAAGLELAHEAGAGLDCRQAAALVGCLPSVVYNRLPDLVPHLSPALRAQAETWLALRAAGPDEVPDFRGPAPLGEPCPYGPGESAKVAVMMDRAARGEALFHPDDGMGLPGWTGPTQDDAEESEGRWRCGQKLGRRRRAKKVHRCWLGRE